VRYRGIKEKNVIRAKSFSQIFYGEFKKQQIKKFGLDLAIPHVLPTDFNKNQKNFGQKMRKIFKML
jgi:hypothetical protein